MVDRARGELVRKLTDAKLKDLFHLCDNAVQLMIPRCIFGDGSPVGSFPHCLKRHALATLGTALTERSVVSTLGEESCPLCKRLFYI